ncbi:MAG: lipoyl(octanoyl) transferase LipB [Bacteroidota bacterium]
MRQKVKFQDLGLTDYFDTWQYQTEIHQKLKDEKKIINNPNPSHNLIFCEHHAVFTLGRSGSQENLIVSPEYLAENNIQFYKINRGGDITYHGPGQIVGYPIFDLDLFFNDVHKYVRLLEESVIQTLEHYNITGYREPGYTGVWINSGYEKRKICAIGVHLSRWISLHGFAFNINTNLDHFNYIIPCGIKDEGKSVTSLEKELGAKQNIDEVKYILKNKISSIFEFDML